MAYNYSSSDEDFDDELESLKNDKSSYRIDAASDYTKKIFDDLHNDLDYAARRKANENEIDNIFDNCVGKLNRVRNHVKETLPTLTLTQQREVVGFWQKAGRFLRKVANWIKRTFLKVLRKIWEGVLFLTEVLKVVNNVFQLVTGWMKIF